MKQLKRIVTVAFGLGLVACSSTPTQIVVEVDADDDVRADAVFLRLQVEGGDSEYVFGEELAFDVLKPVTAGDWPLTHVLAPQGGDASRTYRVVARASRPGGEGLAAVSVTRAISGYVKDEARIFALTLARCGLSRGGLYR